MSQSRKFSAFEAAAGTAIGFATTWLFGQVIYPLVGVQINTAQNTAVVVFFTILSLLRGYGTRRLFNWIAIRFASRTFP
jgi:hypothetical protein